MTHINSQFKRIGKCLKCGKCCIGCKFYKGGKCEIYEKRYESCRNYPNEKNFKDGWLLENCGFKFIENDN